MNNLGNLLRVFGAINCVASIYRLTTASDIGDLHGLTEVFAQSALGSSCYVIGGLFKDCSKYFSSKKKERIEDLGPTIY